jgi:broad specificity phosphatase PhoE
MGLKLYLVRHGQTLWNQEGRLQGHTDIPLSEAGVEEALQLAPLLEPCRFDFVLTSDLARAVQTTELLLNGQASRPPAEPTSLLREVNFGKWEGLTYAEIRATNEALWKRWLHDPFETAPPGGESLNEAIQRLTQILSRLRARPNGHVLIVAHQTSLQLLLTELLGLPRRHYWKFVVDTGSLSCATVYRDVAALELLNYRPTAPCPLSG